MSKRRILIADDSSDERRTLRIKLASNGYEVDEAEGGKAALNMMAENQYDLVTFDLQMADLDGLRVFQRIAATPASDDRGETVIPPCILCTSHQSPDLIEAANKAGFTDVLAKPVTGDLFLKSVERLLRQHSEEAARGLTRRKEPSPAEGIKIGEFVELVSSKVLLVRMPTEITAGTGMDRLIWEVSYELKSTPKHVIFDFSKVNSINSQGIGKLAQLATKVRKADAIPCIAEVVNKGVKGVLEVVKFDQMFRFFPPVKTAKKVLAGS